MLDPSGSEPSHLRLLMSGHPDEGEEDELVEGPLHLSHRRGGGGAAQVDAARGVMEVRVQAPLQGLVEHHLKEAAILTFCWTS